MHLNKPPPQSWDKVVVIYHRICGGYQPLDRHRAPKDFCYRGAAGKGFASGGGQTAGDAAGAAVQPAQFPRFSSFSTGFVAGFTQPAGLLCSTSGRLQGDWPKVANNE